MKNFFFALLFTFGTLTFAQVNPVDFEASGNGADWTWTVFENDTNPPLEIVANPDPSGINTSSTVAKFTALTEGMPFAGCETMHGADVGTFDLSEDNAFVSIMVYKTVLSDVGFKFATPEGASTGEIKIPNTQVNEWERIVFDFTGIINEPSSDGIDQIIVFPDFQSRTTDNIIYFDNIIFGDSSLLGLTNEEFLEVILSPNPAKELVHIDSSFPIENMTVYTYLGQKVYSHNPMSMSFSVNLANLQSGVYYVIMDGNKRRLTKKLVVN